MRFHQKTTFLLGKNWGIKFMFQGGKKCLEKKGKKYKKERESALTTDVWLGGISRVWFTTNAYHKAAMNTPPSMCLHINQQSRQCTQPSYGQIYRTLTRKPTYSISFFCGLFFPRSLSLFPFETTEYKQINLSSLTSTYSLVFPLSFALVFS